MQLPAMTRKTVAELVEPIADPNKPAGISLARTAKVPLYSIEAIMLRLLSNNEPGSWGSTAGSR